MSTLTAQDVYFSQGMTAQPAPLETASAGGPAVSSVHLPLTAWVAMVVLLVVIRMLWEFSG